MLRRESLQLHCVVIAVCILLMIRCASEHHPNLRPHHQSIDVPHRETCPRIGRAVRGGFDLEKSLTAELDLFSCLTHRQTTIHVAS